METSTNLSCNTSTLAPYIPDTDNPWSTQKVEHTYRRLGFGASQDDVDAALALSPSDFIDQLVDTATTLPTTPTPTWGYWAVSDFNDFETENNQFVFDFRILAGNETLTQNVRGRLASFWSNHFVTELETYFYAPYLFQYYSKLQEFSVGNFREFVREIGLTPAMLLYLNGFENTNFNPNENYARELFELFTLGEGNGYTETDITETARALTGYNHWAEPGAPITFDTSTFDDGNKTIFGQTGNWNYNDVIDILFQERGAQVAFFICEKLYRFFVSPSVDADIEQNIIQPLADTLLANDFEMVPMLKQLFKSEHFFDEKALGVIVKSPFDVIFNYINETGFFYDNTVMESVLYYAGLMGQEIFDPPDVSGWQRDETWINTSTLTGRWQLMEIYHFYLFDQGLENNFRDFAIDLTNNSNDPAYITQVIVDYLTSKGLWTVTDYDTATDIFKWEVPQNYYDEGLWNLNWDSAPYQVLLLLNHIARMPEFQLK
ncbi:DUF1800 domain-containing protein [Luteirhabdus pelagi]|uniref:DUF1800 domain-containing protein n=1 Tax=Luteirhabdus pelagi TaxID=2792783 RepID=UPI0019396599|nr:DUF1800 domain-containing protein [Luteirhabdus pelagi]